MYLYYGLTNYHLLCSILHRIIYNAGGKSVFLASQGILKNRINSLREVGIFDEVNYLEDTNVRDSCFNILNENSSTIEIEKVANDFISKYESILPFDINAFDDIYLVADHGVFGIYLLIKQHQYTYLEDGRGIYSKWEVLDNLLRIKNPGIKIMSSYYGAYGKSSLIKKKYVAFDSQSNDCDLNNCIDFDVNILLDKLSSEQLDKIFKVFNLKQYTVNYEKRNALVLTQRFSTYNMLNQEGCILLYALLCDFFAKDCKIYFKPHPADKCNYDEVFKNAVLLDKEMPSELIRFAIKRNFDIGISTYSSSINSLKNYINDIYNIDDSIVNFKDNIFKLYAICKIAYNLHASVLFENNLLAHFFRKRYSLSDNLNIVLNYSCVDKDGSIIVKDYAFNGANYIIKVNKKIENEFISPNLLNSCDILYMKIINAQLIDKLLNFSLDKVLPISKVHIIISIEPIY